MIRGTQKLTSLFPAAVDNSRKAQKGIYTQERDMCLCYRYYYYYEVQRIRMDEAIALMEREFFISANTIMARLVEYADLISDILQNQPQKSELRKKYPHFVWA